MCCHCCLLTFGRHFSLVVSAAVLGPCHYCLLTAFSDVRPLGLAVQLASGLLAKRTVLSVKGRAAES